MIHDRDPANPQALLYPVRMLRNTLMEQGVITPHEKPVVTIFVSGEAFVIEDDGSTRDLFSKITVTDHSDD